MSYRRVVDFLMELLRISSTLSTSIAATLLCILTLLFCLIAVSYTHLDVYKRQVQWRLISTFFYKLLGRKIQASDSALLFLTRKQSSEWIETIILYYIKENNLMSIFKDVLKLIKIIITTPDAKPEHCWLTTKDVYKRQEQDRSKWFDWMLWGGNFITST